MRLNPMRRRTKFSAYTCLDKSRAAAIVRLGVAILLMLASVGVPPTVASAQTGDVGEAAASDEPLVARNPSASAPSTTLPGSNSARAPFQLTPEQQAQLDRLLVAWQASGRKVKTFECDFTRWEYNLQFGTAQRPLYLGTGKIRYSQPDQGLFRVEERKTWDPTAGDWGKPEPGEHWVCDGEALYEFEPKNRQVTKRAIPPEMRGQAIAQGPLPFLFNADANDLRQRYWLRLVPPPKGLEGNISIEAIPRWRQDAANYVSAQFVMSPNDMSPVALMLKHPNGNRDSYAFSDVKKNQLIQRVKEIFHAPTVPFGWKLVEEPIPTAPVPADQGLPPQTRGREF